MTRRVLAGVAVWLIVVAGCAVAAWVVIDRAGRDVAASGSPVGEGMPVTAPTLLDPTTATATSPGSTSPTVGASPSTAPAPPAPNPSPGPPTGSTRPTPGRPPNSDVPPRQPSPIPPAPAPVATVERTFKVTGGTVVVACRGSAPILRSAVAVDGWRVEPKTEDGALEVEFEGPGDASTDVTIRCVAGQPQLSD